MSTSAEIPSSLRAVARSPAAVPVTTVLVNRHARSGANGIDAVVRELRSAPSDVEVISLSRSVDPAAEFLRSSRLPGGRIVIAGGDGTINSCLEAALAHPCPVGIIPLGTANDLARTLELPTDPVEAAGVIVRGSTRRIDVVRLNDHYFVNAAGMGFSTRLTRELDEKTKRVFGALSYPLAVARSIRRQRPFTVRIGGDLNVTRKVIQATIANGRHYGGGMTAHEDADIDDGLLTVLLVEAKPFWQHLMHIANLKTGVYDFDAPFFVGRARAVTVSTRRPKRITADGESVERSPAVFEVLRGKLEIFVP